MDRVQNVGRWRQVDQTQVLFAWVLCSRSTGLGHGLDDNSANSAVPVARQRTKRCARMPPKAKGRPARAECQVDEQSLKSQDGMPVSRTPAKPAKDLDRGCVPEHCDVGQIRTDPSRNHGENRRK